MLLEGLSAHEPEQHAEGHHRGGEGDPLRHVSGSSSGPFLIAPTCSAAGRLRIGCHAGLAAW
ncbi:MAG: hypothetical protein ACREFU_11700 [Acetobacteraceae bacterium]